MTRKVTKPSKKNKLLMKTHDFSIVYDSLPEEETSFPKLVGDRGTIIVLNRMCSRKKEFLLVFSLHKNKIFFANEKELRRLDYEGT